MSAATPVRVRRPRRRGQFAPRFANWIMMVISLYWTLLFARWCAWVLAHVVGDPNGILAALHWWLAWPFVLIPGTARFPLLADLVAMTVTGTVTLGLLGILAGWWREAGARHRR
ncbi:hypothetical protein NET03_03740 [Thermomicrobium sp. CFH 73360]|uniref:hypothetical protein n=1 Tax=Thermomicrobium sp. CFH 73360 TaxID=2951987 RepID=UPI00207686E8|nr:hypothetical protein [Thermomicrobium sp. CFH 73360]MCM8745637.1 hypothetical protein [Thermomicrobium sp. CFH 73360]